MDGVTRVTVVGGLSNPWGLTVHQNYLYYTDLDYEVIERVDKDTGGNMVVMRSGMSGLHALKVHARDSMCIRVFFVFLSLKTPRSLREATFLTSITQSPSFRFSRDHQRLQHQQRRLSPPLPAQTWQ